MTAIIDIIGREILDSRGNPTVEVDVILEDGSMAVPPCPRAPRPARTRPWNCATAASATRARACSGPSRRSMARSTRRSPASMPPASARSTTRSASWTAPPTRAGSARTRCWGVSLAVAKAAAEAVTLPLYRYVGGVAARTLPVPMMNIINGGEHADNPIDIQEFMVMPVGAETIRDAVRIGSEIFHTLRAELKAAGHNTNVGDEGGFAPNIGSTREALDFIMASVEKAGYAPGDDVMLGAGRRLDRVLPGRQVRHERRG